MRSSAVIVAMIWREPKITIGPQIYPSVSHSTQDRPINTIRSMAFDQNTQSFINLWSIHWATYFNNHKADKSLFNLTLRRFENPRVGIFGGAQFKSLPGIHNSWIVYCMGKLTSLTGSKQIVFVSVQCASVCPIPMQAKALQLWRLLLVHQAEHS